MNRRTSVESTQTTSKPVSDVAPGSVWTMPAYGPDGVRHRGGAILSQALALNCGNLRRRCQAKGPSPKGEADSSEAPSRDGAVRSSVSRPLQWRRSEGTASSGGWRVQLKNDKSVADLSAMLGPILRGWQPYYGHFHGSALKSVWRRVNRSLIGWLMRKHKGTHMGRFRVKGVQFNCVWAISFSVVSASKV